MKRSILLMVLIITSLLSSCDSLNLKSITSLQKKENISVNDYVFHDKNVKLKFKGIGNEYAEKEIYIDYLKENRIQYRINNPGTVMCQIVEIKNGELRVIYNQGEFYYRYNLLNNTYNDKYDVILKEPIKKGTTWYSKDRNKRYINAINKKINTPFKNIQGVEVITEGKDYKIYDYFVKNLGLVKTVFVANQSSIETTLEKIEKNALVTQIVKFYYPNINNNKIEYEEKMVSFQTNDSVPEKFLMYLRNPSQKSHFKIFDSKTKINKLILNDNIAILDISSEFINYLNSIKQKTLILQSLVNTFGNYYNVNKVKIIVNNNVIYENKISLMNH